MIFVIELKFCNLQKKRLNIDQVAYYNIITIRIDIFQFYVTITNNLVFSSYTYLLLFDELLKNENKYFLEFF
jgi:hypothetical protein